LSFNVINNNDQALSIRQKMNSIFSKSVNLVSFTADTNSDYKVDYTNIITLDNGVYFIASFPASTDNTQNTRISIDNGITYYNLIDDAGNILIGSVVENGVFAIYFNGSNYESLFPIDSAKYSPIQTISGDINKFVNGTKDSSKVNSIISGITLYNEISNGDFSSGTTGFTGVNTVLTSSNNILTATNDGTDAIPIIQTNLTTNTGDTWFAYTRARVTNSDAINIYIRLGSSSSDNIEVIPTPTANVWYELSGRLTKTSDDLVFNIYQQYADAATANGKVMEVDGETGIFAVNLTKLGLTSLTDEELLEKIRQGYFEGLTYGTVDIETINKNLFDGQLELGRYDVGTGAEVTSSSFVRNVNPIRVKPSSNIVSNTLTDDTFLFYDINMNYISFVSTLGTVPSNAYYMNVYYNVSDKDENLQIEYGNAPTDYEPQQTNTFVYEDKVIKSLPNGTVDILKDSDQVGTALISKDNWQHIQNISDETNIVGVVSVNTTNYPLAKDGGQFVNFLDSGSFEIGTIGTDSTTGNGTMLYELNIPVITELTELDSIWAYMNGVIQFSSIYNYMQYTVPYNSDARLQDVSDQLAILEDKLQRSIISLGQKTLIQASWVDDTAGSGFYTYNLSDILIKDHHDAIFSPTRDTQTIFRNAVFANSNDVNNGEIVFYADNKPTGDIVLNITLEVVY